MLVMDILWQMPDGGCVADILTRYPEPRPAYNTVATFLKILENKGFVAYRRGRGKLHLYYALMSREEYRRRVMADVKDTFFGGSATSMLDFFVREERLSADDIRELLAIVQAQDVNPDERNA